LLGGDLEEPAGLREATLPAEETVEVTDAEVVVRFQATLGRGLLQPLDAGRVVLAEEEPGEVVAGRHGAQFGGFE